MKFLTQHPAEMGETYFQHAYFALYISWQCLLVSFQAAVHAILPCCWTYSASQRLKQLQVKISDRNNQSD